jgi:hypothetical protein
MTVGQVKALVHWYNRQQQASDGRQQASSKDLLEWLPGAEVEYRRADVD